MAYPASLDNLAADKGDATDATSGSPTGGAAGDHAAHHNALATAVNAVEAELGVTPKGTFADVAARLSARTTVRKTADQSFTTQVLANVTDLALPVLANLDYYFRFVIAHTGGTARGIGLGLTVPGGVNYLSALARIIGPSVTAGTDMVTEGVIEATGGSLITAATLAGTHLAVIEGILSVGATAGSLQLQCRQGSGATAANAVVKKGSYGEMYVN